MSCSRLQLSCAPAGGSAAGAPVHGAEDSAGSVRGAEHLGAAGFSVRLLSSRSSPTRSVSLMSGGRSSRRTEDLSVRTCRSGGGGEREVRLYVSLTKSVKRFHLSVFSGPLGLTMDSTPGREDVMKWFEAPPPPIPPLPVNCFPLFFLSRRIISARSESARSGFITDYCR